MENLKPGAHREKINFLPANSGTATLKSRPSLWQQSFFFPQTNLSANLYRKQPRISFVAGGKDQRCFNRIDLCDQANSNLLQRPYFHKIVGTTSVVYPSIFTRLNPISAWKYLCLTIKGDSVWSGRSVSILPVCCALEAPQKLIKFQRSKISFIRCEW